MPAEHTHHHLVESSSTTNGAVHGGLNGTALVGQPIGMQNMLSVAINYNRQVQALALVSFELLCNVSLTVALTARLHARHFTCQRP